LYQVLREVWRISVLDSFLGSTLTRLFSHPLDNFVKLSFETSIARALEHIRTVASSATNLEKLTVSCSSPLEIQWFHDLGNLKRLRVAVVKDDEPSHIFFWPINIIQGLVIDDCSSAITFNFLHNFSHLKVLSSLSAASQLRLPALLPVIQSKLFELTLTKA
jgi:hypothetical protein